MTRRLVAALAGLILMAGACGSDSGSSSDATSKTKLTTDGSPESWADAACTAALRLIDDLEPAAAALQAKVAELGESSDPAAGFTTFITAFGELLHDMADPFSRLADDMESLGAPDVEGGDEYFTQLNEGLAKANEAIDSIVAVFDTLPENPTLDDLASLEQLGNEDAFAGLDSIGSLEADAPTELSTALAESETCTTTEARFADLQAKFESLA